MCRRSPPSPVLTVPSAPRAGLCSCSTAEVKPLWLTSVHPCPQVVQMQCNLERSEDKARWHVSRGVGPVGDRAGGAIRGLGGLWEPTTPFCLHSSLCFWCWRTGCTGSSLTTCSQVGWAGTQAGTGAAVGPGSGLTPLSRPCLCPCCSRQCPGPRHRAGTLWLRS